MVGDGGRRPRGCGPTLTPVFTGSDLMEALIWPLIITVTYIHVRLSATPWTVACQAPLSMEFSRREYILVGASSSSLILLIFTR